LSGVTEVIFVDESGDPGLSKGSIQRQAYVTIGFVYCKNPQLLRKKLKRLLKRLHQRGKYPPHLSELKFYLPDTDLIQKGYTKQQLRAYEAFLPNIRTKAISIICKEATGVFAAVIDKRKAYSSWTPEELCNFAFVQTLIVNIMNTVSPANPPAILFDMGRLSPARTRFFKSYLVNKDSFFEHKGYKRYRGSLGPPIEVASYDEPGIWAADIVAGAFYHKYAHKDWAYSNALAPVLIGNGERLFWS